MNRVRIVSFLALPAVFMICACIAAAQQSFSERFQAHNNSMTALQPAFVTPLVEADARLLQYARASVSHEYTAARTETVNYGNGRGMGLIFGKSFEFDYAQPVYIQHNSSAVDGFGDTTVLAKYRIASGNAQHGNFDVAAILSHTFATGSYKNGAVTDCFNPTLASGNAFRHFDVMTSLGGAMPTGKIAAQGRSIAWNSLGPVSRYQARVVRGGEQRHVLLQRNARRNDAELCHSGSFLCGAAQGLEADASLLHHRWRHADRHLRLPHLQPQPDRRGSSPVLTKERYT
jgi:hypothetical protein